MGWDSLRCDTTRGRLGPDRGPVCSKAVFELAAFFQKKRDKQRKGKDGKGTGTSHQVMSCEFSGNNVGG